MDYRVIAIEVDGFSGTPSVTVGHFKSDSDEEAKVKAWEKFYREDNLEEEEKEEIDEYLEGQDSSDSRIETITNLITGEEIFDLGTGLLVSIEDWN